jgi:hypothetical protein
LHNPPALLIAAFHCACALILPGTRFELAGAMPPGVVEAAPAARHRHPAAAFDAAYSSVFHIPVYISSF